MTPGLRRIYFFNVNVGHVWPLLVARRPRKKGRCTPEILLSALVVQFVQKLFLWVIWVSLDHTVRALSLNTRQKKVINVEKINTPQAGGQKSTPARLKKSKQSTKSKKKRKQKKKARSATTVHGAVARSATAARRAVAVQISAPGRSGAKRRSTLADQHTPTRPRIWHSASVP